MAQKNIVKQKVAPLTSRTMRRISAETVLETDTPRTCELKNLRIKRLAYFCDSKRSNMLSTKPALHSTSEACLESENNSKTEIQTSTACDFLQPCELRCRNERLQEVPETCPQNNVEKMASKDMVTNIIPGKEIPFIDPDYNLLEDSSVPETEKLRHVINWAQKVISRPQLENNDITNSLDFCSTVLSNKDTCRELNKESETEGHGSSLSSLQHSTSSKQAIGFPDSTLQLIQNIYLNHQGIHQGIHVDGKDRDRDCDQSSAAISNKNKADSEFHIAQPRSVAENRKRDLKNKIISSAPDGSYFWIPLEDSSDEEYAGKTKRVSDNINYLEGITHNNHPVGTSFNRRNVEQFFSSSDIPLNSTPSEKLFPRNQNSRDHAWINELRNDRSGVGGSCLAENSIKSNLNNIKYEKENPQEQYINNYLSLVSDPEMQEVRPSVLGLELLAFEEKCLKDTSFQNDVHTGRTFTVRNAESSKEHNMFYNTIIATNKSLNEKQKRQECQESYPVYFKNSFILQSQDSGLLKYCPDCGSANNGMLNWCTDCECTLIGIPAQFKQINSNRDSKVMFSDGRRAINDHVKIKNEKLLKDTKYGQVEPNDMSNRSIYHQCFQDTGDVNNPSSDSESDLSMYEKYLFYKEYLNRNKTLDQGSKDTFELLPAGDHEQLKCTRYSSSDVALNTRTVCQSEQKKCIIKEKEEEPIYEQLEAPANYFSSKDTTTGCVAVNETPWDWESHRTDTELENFQQDYTAQGLYTEKQLDKAPKDSSNFLEKLLGELDFKENDTSQEHKTPKKYSKDLKPQKSKSVQPRLPGSKRYWEKSSIAWTSFTHGELKPRSQNIKRPSSADSDRKTAKEHSQKKQLKTGNHSCCYFYPYDVVHKQ
ncbi:uncharacterized protein LOC122810613 [Protopterus annectens]|uniref:uncharacterized protein LOC122810613 n=1 Tax=Protopterus annectens TaxID=7888 RepID=UPI001CFB0A4A|nr:uncharacterized protein LOC122810613 [Protopterus annectens]